jgi:hypothetical protein
MTARRGPRVPHRHGASGWIRHHLHGSGDAHLQGAAGGVAAPDARRPQGEHSHVITLQKRLEGGVGGRDTGVGRCAGVVGRGPGRQGTGARPHDCRRRVVRPGEVIMNRLGGRVAPAASAVPRVSASSRRSVMRCSRTMPVWCSTIVQESRSAMGCPEAIMTLLCWSSTPSSAGWHARRPSSPLSNGY